MILKGASKGKDMKIIMYFNIYLYLSFVMFLYNLYSVNSSAFQIEYRGKVFTNLLTNTVPMLMDTGRDHCLVL